MYYVYEHYPTEKKYLSIIKKGTRMFIKVNHSSVERTNARQKLSNIEYKDVFSFFVYCA